MNFGDVGRICLNGEIEEICQNCPWLEWDALRQQCNNCHYPFCPLGRDKLLSEGSQVRGNLGAAVSDALEPAVAGLEGRLAVKGQGSGTA